MQREAYVEEIRGATDMKLSMKRRNGECMRRMVTCKKGHLCEMPAQEVAKKSKADPLAWGFLGGWCEG